MQVQRVFSEINNTLYIYFGGTMLLVYFLAVAGIDVNAIKKERSKPLWSYDDESTWPGATCKGGGVRQSPIDIRTSNVIMDLEKTFIKFGKLKFKGYRDTLVSGVNNGHTIQFTMDGAQSMHPSVTGGPLKHEYRLEQIHFHWVSEHSVDGFKFPMEIHFVHKRRDLTVSQALEHADGLAIIAVFCNVQPEPEDEADLDQTDMDEVMQHMSKLRGFGAHVSGVVMDLRKMLSKNPQAYVTYSGSLTSPECNEVVTWIIMDHPVYMYDTQYRNLSKLGLSRNNFRRLQPSNHTLFRPLRAYFNTPYIVQVLKDMIGIIKGFLSNITGLVDYSTAALKPKDTSIEYS